MKIIAMEEAFSVPGMSTPDPSATRPKNFRASALRDQERKLPDFTEYRLQEMDENGVDVQVLSLTTPGVQLQPDTAVAISDAQLANDVLAAAIEENPTRFAGLAAVPLQDPTAAVRELDRAVNDLGLSGVLVNGHTLGHYLDEPPYLEFWEALAGHDLPLYIHPTSAPLNWPVLEGHPEMATAVYGWAAETGAHGLRLIFSGLFDRFATLKVILGHMGEFLSFQAWRLDSRISILDTDVKLAKKPSEYIADNIAITTSGVCSPGALVGAVATIGADSILFAIDYPYESTALAVDFLRTAPLSEPDRHKVAHGNAERLLHLT
jgi:2,3-dihydroxybenzoate decarboxylase